MSNKILYSANMYAGQFKAGIGIFDRDTKVTVSIDPCGVVMIRDQYDHKSIELVPYIVDDVELDMSWNVNINGLLDLAELIPHNMLRLENLWELLDGDKCDGYVSEEKYNDELRDIDSRLMKLYVSLAEEEISFTLFTDHADRNIACVNLHTEQ